MWSTPKLGSLVLVWLIACLPRFWGCRPASDHVTVEDSVGIRIVTYPPLENVMSAVELSTVLELRIGGTDAPEGRELQFILGRPVIVGGRLYVTDAFVDAVRSFDLESGGVSTFGSEGRGPGQFRYPAVAGPWQGDSVAVYDSRLRRISIVDGSFRGYRVFTVSNDVGRFAAAAGVLPGGHLVFSGSFGLVLEGRRRLVRDTIPVIVTDAEGTVVSTFGEVVTRGIFEGGPQLDPAALQIPFMPGDRVVAGPCGVHVASEGRAEVRLYDATGSPRLFLRFEAASVPVTEAQEDSTLAAELEGFPNPQGMRRFFSVMPIPEAHPPIAQMGADQLGRLWLQPTPTPDTEHAPWFVFDTDGSLVGSYVLPPGELATVTADRAVLVTHDEYDSPVVDVHRITDWR